MTSRPASEALGSTHSRTLVFVHAHPDDEALLTAGTMARAVAEGNRVVLIVATDGAAGLSDADHAEDLAAHRQEELSRSAHILGVDRLINLGYADSGLHGEVADGFAHQPKFAVAKLIAAILDDENCDILIGYDPSGGYGHPDHVQVIGELPVYVTGTAFWVTPVIGLVNPACELVANADEVQDVFEVPLAFLMNPANHRRHTFEWQGAHRDWFSMAYQEPRLSPTGPQDSVERFIWGATAALLRNLYQFLMVNPSK
jgi:hypothetical protein